MSEHIKRIGVIGAGIMGHGIAQEFAVAGYKVHLTDSSPGSLQKAGGTIAANLAESRNSPILLNNISFFTSLAEAMDAVDFVVEAVTENLPLKQRLFAEIDQHAPPHAILASNSSSFMPSQLAPSTKRPQQVLYKRIGKVPVVVEKERLGFIGNRLQLALFREALALVDEGVCSIQDVDTVIHTSIGRRWSAAGVFEVFDLAGLDTVLAVATQLFPDLSNATEPPESLKRRVAQGDLGIKSGMGFYDWPPEHALEAKARIRNALLRSEQRQAVEGAD